MVGVAHQYVNTFRFELDGDSRETLLVTPREEACVVFVEAVVRMPGNVGWITISEVSTLRGL